MRVLMVDDHIMFLQGMKNLLNVLAPDVLVDSADTLPFALQLLHNSTYDLVLLDWHLPDCPGEEAIRRLRNVGCMGRIVVLSSETDTVLIRSTIDAGAAGFIPKQFSAEQMVNALDDVLQGHVYLPAETVGHTAAPGLNARVAESDPRFASLTTRQIETYRAATRGLSNKLIARELNIAESTVKSHLAAVYAVLGVHNRTEAAYQASRDGTRVV